MHIPKQRVPGMPVSPFVSRALLVAQIKGVHMPVVAPAIEEAFAKLNERIAILTDDAGAPLERLQFMAGTSCIRDVNPQGRMPTLEIDGRFIGESVAICEVLDDQFPEPSLLPSDLIDRGRLRQLVLACNLSLTSQVWPLVEEINPATRDPDRLLEIKTEIGRALAEMEQLMGSSTYAWGSSLTLADCILVFTMLPLHCALTTRPENLGINVFTNTTPFAAHPKRSAWWAQMQRDPIVGPAMQRYRSEYASMLGHLNTPSLFGDWVRARSLHP